MESPRKIPDEVRQILARVCAEHGVRIDADDPVMAVIMLNRLALEAALTRGVDRIEDATAELKSQFDTVQVRIGAALAQEMRSALRCSEKLGYRAESPAVAVPSDRRKLAFASVGIFAVGLLTGILIR